MAAKERLNGRPDADFLLLDYGDPAWLETIRPYAPFDVVVSGFSIHHQSDERKQAVYAEIYDLLTPGGIFINIEHVASLSSWGAQVFDDYFIDSLYAFQQQIGSGKSRDEVAREYVHRPDKVANILAPVETQCQWLRQIGYERVDCYLKIFELAVFGGMKVL